MGDFHSTRGEKLSGPIPPRLQSKFCSSSRLDERMFSRVLVGSRDRELVITLVPSRAPQYKLGENMGRCTDSQPVISMKLKRSNILSGDRIIYRVIEHDRRLILFRASIPVQNKPERQKAAVNSAIISCLETGFNGYRTGA